MQSFLSNMSSIKFIVVAILYCVVIVGCTKHKGISDIQIYQKDNQEAKKMLQGIWVDELTEDIVFKIDGDTIIYPDNFSRSVSFYIYNDSLQIETSSEKYLINKITSHNFWITDSAGETLKLVKSSLATDTLEFCDNLTLPLIIDKLVKRDTIVYYKNIRYRVYTTINPSKFKVYKSVLNDDGLMVDNVYYDNIINVAIFKGRDRLYSCNFNKNMFSYRVPKAVLDKSVFGDMQFVRLDAAGFHYRATIGIPDEAGAYVADTVVFKL